MLIVHCVALDELSLHIHCLSRAHVLSSGLLSRLVASCIRVIPAFSRPLCLPPLFLSVMCLRAHTHTHTRTHALLYVRIRSYAYTRINFFYSVLISYIFFTLFCSVSLYFMYCSLRNTVNSLFIPLLISPCARRDLSHNKRRFLSPSLSLSLSSRVTPLRERKIDSDRAHYSSEK